MNINGNIKLQTRPWLWALAAGLVFVMLGFVDFVPALGKGAGLAYWRCLLWTWENGGEELQNSGFYLALFTVALGVPAIAIGWVLQCLVDISFVARSKGATSEAEKGRGNP